MTLTIGIDLDEVLYPYVDRMRSYLILDGLIHPDATPAPPTWAVWDAWGLTRADYFDAMARYVHEGTLYRFPGPPLAALRVLHRLRAAGHRIHVITARRIPLVEDEVAEATVRWLKDYQVPHDALTITQVKSEVAVDVHLDDVPEHLDAMTAAQGTWGILWDRPWNTRRTDLKRVASWPAFEVEVHNAARIRTPRRSA